MATLFTDSVASGYMTNVLRNSFGPFKCFVAHFSSPISGTSTSTAYVDCGMNTIRFVIIQNDVDSSLTYTTGTQGQQFVNWCFTTNLATGTTGNLFILGL